jgi:hypothetical protein
MNVRQKHSPRYGPNMVQTWSAHSPNILQTRSNHAPNMFQIWSKYAPSIIQTGSQYAPSMLQLWSKYGQHMLHIYETNVRNMLHAWFNCTYFSVSWTNWFLPFVHRRRPVPALLHLRLMRRCQMYIWPGGLMRMFVLHTITRLHLTYTAIVRGVLKSVLQQDVASCDKRHVIWS